MTDKQAILTFINKFKEKYPSELEDTFSNGYCYYFALMLRERFGGLIMFNAAKVHFAFRRKGLKEPLYDIKGIVHINDDDDWWEWDDYVESYPYESSDVIISCIRKRV